MRFSAFSFAAGLALLCAPAHHAWAADCKPLQLVNAVPLEPMENDNRFAVPIQIDGHAEHLIVDSGTPFTMLSLDAAKRLGLKLRGSLVSSANVKGQLSSAQEPTRSISAARMRKISISIFIRDK